MTIFGRADNHAVNGGISRHRLDGVKDAPAALRRDLTREPGIDVADADEFCAFDVTDEPSIAPAHEAEPDDADSNRCVIHPTPPRKRASPFADAVSMRKMTCGELAGQPFLQQWSLRRATLARDGQRG